MIIRHPTEQDLDRCIEIEALSYSPEEAATKEKIETRIREYPEGFIVLEVEGEIAGFINSGATHEVDLSSEEFKGLDGHDPTGPNIVILSVVTHPDFRGMGISSKLMHHFLDMMREMKKINVYLICQEELVPMYAKYGFSDLGPSSSSHGGKNWNEMSLSLIQ